MKQDLRQLVRQLLVFPEIKKPHSNIQSIFELIHQKIFKQFFFHFSHIFYQQKSLIFNTFQAIQQPLSHQFSWSCYYLNMTRFGSFIVTHTWRHANMDNFVTLLSCHLTLGPLLRRPAFSHPIFFTIVTHLKSCNKLQVDIKTIIFLVRFSLKSFSAVWAHFDPYWQP